MRAYADMCSTCGKLELGGVITHMPDCPERKDMASESRGIYGPDQVAAGEATARRMTQAMGMAQQGELYVDGPEERHAQDVVRKQIAAMQSRQRELNRRDPELTYPAAEDSRSSDAQTVRDARSRVEECAERLRAVLDYPKCQGSDEAVQAQDPVAALILRLRSVEYALDACLRVVERL